MTTRLYRTVKTGEITMEDLQNYQARRRYPQDLWSTFAGLETKCLWRQKDNPIDKGSRKNIGRQPEK